MPLGRDKLERADQLVQWLRDNFPTPLPVTVQIHTHGLGHRYFRKQQMLGECWRRGNRLYVWVDGLVCESLLMDTLMHEWSHAVSTRQDCMERLRVEESKHHDDEFFLVYGRIYRRYFDENGRKELRRYTPRRRRYTPRQRRR